MEQATINGMKLAFEVTGAGEPVLLIGTGPIADSFAPFRAEPALADRFQLISYQQRRADGGVRLPAPVSFAQHAADAVALLGHLGVHRAHVAGHSTGAAIALQMAVDHPERVHSLALLEPPLLSAPSAGAFFERAGPAIAAYGAGGAEEAMTQFLGVVSSLGWERCRAVVERSVPGAAAQAIANADNFFGSYLPALEAWRFGAIEAAAIDVPVLSVVGTDTDRLFAESHGLIRTWLPQAESGEIRDVGHLLHLQRPDPVARCLAEFFIRHPIAVERHVTSVSPAVLGLN